MEPLRESLMKDDQHIICMEKAKPVVPTIADQDGVFKTFEKTTTNRINGIEHQPCTCSIGPEESILTTIGLEVRYMAFQKGVSADAVP